MLEVGTGDDPVGAEVPVRALSVFGLVPEHGGLDVGQVVIPLVVAAVDAAQQVVIAVPSDEAEQAHGGDRGEGGDVVRTVFLDGVDLCPGNQLRSLIPTHSFPAPFAPGRLVGPSPLLVLHDGRPGLDGVFARLPLPLVEVPQHSTDVGELRPQGAVRVPGGSHSPLAAPGLHVGDVRVDLGIVYLLQLPADQAVFDEDLPTTGHRAVDTVARPDAVVIRPSLSVKLLPGSRFTAYLEPFTLHLTSTLFLPARSPTNVSAMIARRPMAKVGT
jgi:hypothetical protein